MTLWLPSGPLRSHGSFMRCDGTTTSGGRHTCAPMVRLSVLGATTPPSQSHPGPALRWLIAKPASSTHAGPSSNKQSTQAIPNFNCAQLLLSSLISPPALIAQADKLASLAGVSARVPNLKPKFLVAKLLLRSTKRNVFDWSTESRFAPQHLHLFRNKGARFVKDVGSITMHWRAR